MEFSKEKQIEEMAKVIADCGICIYHGDVIWKEEDVSDDLALCIAMVLNEQGYRKSQDVAEEIFEEIDEELGGLMNTYHKSQRFSDADVIRYARCLISELKKKYESEKDNG